MVSLTGCLCSEDGDSFVSDAPAPAPAPSPSATSKSGALLIHQDHHNEPMTHSTETRNIQSDNEQLKDASTSALTPEIIRAIIQNDFIKRLAHLPAEHFGHHLQLQRTSPFWTKLLNPPEENTDGTYRPPTLTSREWAEYVVDASRIFFDAGLSVDKVVSIIDRAICFAAICLLNRPTEKIYFEDGRNVFYEFESRGIPREMKPKYKAFLTGMRASILEGKDEVQSNSGMDMIQGSGDESEAVGEVSHVGDAVTPLPEGDVKVTSQEETTGILRWELSTTPAEVKDSTPNDEERSDGQDQAAINSPLSKNARRNRKLKERRKRARAQAKLSQSKDAVESKQEDSCRQNQS